jgi:hypothetical protein
MVEAFHPAAESGGVTSQQKPRYRREYRAWPLYATLDMPTRGSGDPAKSVVPVDRLYRLVEAMPGAELIVVDVAVHLIRPTNQSR